MSSYKMKLIVTLFFMVVGANIVDVCNAQETQAQPFEINAPQKDIEGDWQLIPLPDTMEPHVMNNPWPQECQWYSYAPSGSLKSIDKTSGPCEELTGSKLEETILHVNDVVSWKYDMSPVHQKALIIVSRKDVRGYAEYWEPHIVTKDFSKNGIEFKQGDLIFYLVNLHTGKITWIRHLRRLPA